MEESTLLVRNLFKVVWDIVVEVIRQIFTYFWEKKIC